ncbi:ThiJ/PfpI family protein [Delphinella strobiligena]|nr:ThiJ/PfpI family protein [Delphinella strobiligena]
MSAIIPEDGEAAAFEPVKVLFALHQGLDALDFIGPLEILSTARHDPKNPDSRAFECTFASEEQSITATQGVDFRSNITFKEAHKRLSEFDVLVIPGGKTEIVLKNKSEPLALIKSYAEIQQKNPSRERTLLSICTGSLFLAETGILAGLCATTHPDYITRLESMCQSSAQHNLTERTDVMEERYVVNNLRFDLGEEDDNPYIQRRPNTGRRHSNARKGSFSFKESNTRRESVGRRATLKLGGLRVITSGGITTGFDAALYLVSALVSYESANEVARIMQYEWHKGVVVKGIDV